VREDLSSDGNAWQSFSHDQARSRAYRWGEDGIGGISDNKQRLCFCIALWNGRDPILKERLFGLTNDEGNHGEDVKEYYFYLDSTPTHSWMRFLYKYPQAAFPYEDLVHTNARRTAFAPEYELIDTGVFDDDKYFDVFVNYAKGSPTDLLIEIAIHNRGSERASLRVLPSLWFRNTWTPQPNLARPRLHQWAPGTVEAHHPTLGTYWLVCEGAPRLLFTENETNPARAPDASADGAGGGRYYKDGINDFVVKGMEGTINPEQRGTKVAADYLVDLEGGTSATLRLRLSEGEPRQVDDGFAEVLQVRSDEADEFYAAAIPSALDADQRHVARQAYAGLLWSKQYYALDVSRWLHERGHASVGKRSWAAGVRNAQWPHLVCDDVISMPDKWEYPWYAAWDLAFHAVAFVFIDPDFAKDQLKLLLRHEYLHPNGQLPAYEWSFDDVNPPVHAWAAYFIYTIERAFTGHADSEFLRYMFEKLLLNFTWWVNRKDPTGSNVFQGGFLGLDNIGIFDRSQSLPTGGYIEQADGTAWMAFYCQMLLGIALELAPTDPLYEELAAKFLEQGLRIIAAMDGLADNESGLWDEHDDFFYDVLRLPDGSARPLKVRSLVGLLPLCATIAVSHHRISPLHVFGEHVAWIREHRPELAEQMAHIATPGHAGLYLFSALDKDLLVKVLHHLLDEDEFLSPFGIRSISKRHLKEPYVFTVNGHEYRVAYEPAESTTRMFGGNSNWRGPIWMPINMLVVRSLELFGTYYGEDLKVELPTGSGHYATLHEVAAELAQRLERIFLRDENGRRPVYGGTEKFQTDPHWRDLILFYEYFHGDNGAGIGASHQTGWTALIAQMSTYFGSHTDTRRVLEPRQPRSGAPSQ
jgi:hypothetical protein